MTYTTVDPRILRAPPLGQPEAEDAETRRTIDRLTREYRGELLALRGVPESLEMADTIEQFYARARTVGQHLDVLLMVREQADLMLEAAESAREAADLAYRDSDSPTMLEMGRDAAAMIQEMDIVVDGLEGRAGVAGEGLIPWLRARDASAPVPTITHWLAAKMAAQTLYLARWGQYKMTQYVAIVERFEHTRSLDAALAGMREALTRFGAAVGSIMGAIVEAAAQGAGQIVVGAGRGLWAIAKPLLIIAAVVVPLGGLGLLAYANRNKIALWAAKGG